MSQFMPMNFAAPRQRLQDIGQCLNLALRGLCAVVAWAAVQHGRSRHSLRGNGKRQKTDQHGSEHLPHNLTLQQLPQRPQRFTRRTLCPG